MIESGYYPSGCQYDKAAPWNIDDQPEKEFNVTCSQSLSRTVPVFTSHYNTEYDGKNPITNTSDTVWVDEYVDNKHLTPIQLIDKFRDVLKEQLKTWEGFEETPIGKKEISKIEHLIEECSGWIEDETECFEE